MAKFISQSVEVLNFPEDPIRAIAQPARVCYNSAKRDYQQEVRFVKSLLSSGHMTPFEHTSASVLLTTNRAVTHELVRHRIGVAFNQSSQRYINYKDGVEFIRPLWTYPQENNSHYVYWAKLCTEVESIYAGMIEGGLAPEEARDVLPNSTATKIVVTANFREWMHIFDLRLFGLTGRPHPEIKALMAAVYLEFGKRCPELFSADFDVEKLAETVTIVRK